MPKKLYVAHLDAAQLLHSSAALEFAKLEHAACHSTPLKARLVHTAPSVDHRPISMSAGATATCGHLQTWHHGRPHVHVQPSGGLHVAKHASKVVMGMQRPWQHVALLAEDFNCCHTCFCCTRMRHAYWRCGTNSIWNAYGLCTKAQNKVTMFVTPSLLACPPRNQARQTCKWASLRALPQ